MLNLQTKQMSISFQPQLICAGTQRMRSVYQSKTSSIKVTIPGTDVAGPHFVFKYESKSNTIFLYSMYSDHYVLYPGGMVRTETYLRSQSGNGPLVDRSSPIKNLCSTGLL